MIDLKIYSQNLFVLQSTQSKIIALFAYYSLILKNRTYFVAPYSQRKLWLLHLNLYPIRPTSQFVMHLGKYNRDYFRLNLQKY